MNILHIIPSLRKGGAERLTLDICQQLSLLPDVKVLVLVFYDQHDYKLIYPDVPVKCIPSSVELSILGKNFYNIQALQEEIIAFAPDIIHSHLLEAEIVSRSCYYPYAKWFSHCHDNMPVFQNLGVKTFLSKRAFARFYEKCFLFSRYAMNSGNHFISISGSTHAYFEKRIGKAPLYFLKNAINILRFKAANEGLSKGKLRLINIGSFVAKKNQQFLIDVASELKKLQIEFELHLLGDGSERAAIEEKVRVLGLQKEVFIHGSVDHVEYYLHRSSIYVHSALYEPFGLVIVEAMAAGLPVVCLDGEGNRDLVEDGKNGYMIFNTEPKEMALKIQELWSDQELLYRMSQQAKTFAEDYDINPYVAKLLSVYKSVLNG